MSPGACCYLASGVNANALCLAGAPYHGESLTLERGGGVETRFQTEFNFHERRKNYHVLYGLDLRCSSEGAGWHVQNVDASAVPAPWLRSPAQLLRCGSSSVANADGAVPVDAS
ncbi:hypothetical protein SKAU_G00302990 [Synaphobranchus kaupii]|uniref:Uncharacterized protein n=1 Tax=Synaphobranchus kaupii TaxID=118154 RepID=A0A9Q1INH5_SYNKA|nr:hypothetical protein SKAU_G00302990 [Synaphobranchus kaupii]